MGHGNWSVGLVIDERASAEQREAITAIASGAAGGPMAALSGLIGKFLGVESAPIAFERSGVKWSVKASSFVDMAAQGAMGLNPGATEPLHLENTGHPAADRFALAHAVEEPRQRARPLVGRHQRNEQRAVRAVRLAGCLARRRSRHRAATASIVWACIALITVLAWAYLLHLDREMSSSMAHDRMMAEMGMTMDMPWTSADVFFTFAMWAVMMVGMMAGPATPDAAAVCRHAADTRLGSRCRWRCRRSGLATCAVWTGFSACAALAQ